MTGVELHSIFIFEKLPVSAQGLQPRLPRLYGRKLCYPIMRFRDIRLYVHPGPEPADTALGDDQLVNEDARRVMSC